MQPPRARIHIPPMGVCGVVTTPGRPLSPLSAARASPVAARRGGSLVTPPSVRPPALCAQHLGDLASLASPSGSFSRWVVDRRRAAGYRQRIFSGSPTGDAPPSPAPTTTCRRHVCNKPSGRRLMLSERRLMPSGRRHDLTHLA